MADGITLNSGSGGATLKTDNDGTYHHQCVKIEWGPDDTQTPVDTGAAAVPIQDGGNSITVDGTVAVSTIAGTVNVNASGTTVPITGAVTVTNATAANLKVDLSGTAANSTAILVTSTGNVAHDAADSGNPVKMGAKCVTSPKGVTLVSNADRSDLICDSDGKLLVKVGTTGADLISERVTDTGGTSTAFTNFSAVSSTYNYVDAITVSNSHASTFCTVDFRDGTAGSVLWTVPVPPSSGVVMPKGSSPYFRTSANTALAYDVSAAVSTITICVSGYQSKV